MPGSPPTSIRLPMHRWTKACGEIADQLGDFDGLLVIPDDGTDPVASRPDNPEDVRLVGAGKPEGCSGKANAMAAGTEPTGNDRLVWTDDDFHQPPDCWGPSTLTTTVTAQCPRCHISSGETPWLC